MLGETLSDPKNRQTNVTQDTRLMGRTSKKNLYNKSLDDITKRKRGV